MSWVKLDDQFPDHPKVLDAGPLAAWLYVCGLGYCGRLLTDGFIPAGQVRKLADVDDAPALAARLVAVGLWEETEGGYRVHDYLDFQPSREKALQIREARAEAGSRGGKQKASNLLARSQDGASDSLVANGKQNSTPYPSRTHPVPLPIPDTHTEPVGDVGEVPPARKPTPAPKRADARPLPTVETLTDQLRSWATAKGVSDILADEVERFHDYCLSKIDPETGCPPGSKKPLYTDYAAACRRFITNPDYGHTSRPRQSASPARAAPLSNEQAKRERTIAALRGVGGHREPIDVPNEPLEARFSVVRRDHAG